MDKKNTGIIATVVAVILCGCPGICVGIFAAITAAGVMPYTTTFNDVTNTGTIPTTWGYVGLCVSGIFILIPILIGIFTLRKKSTEVVNAPPVPPVEPIQPITPQPPVTDIPVPQQPPVIDISTPAQPAEPGETIPPQPSNPDEPLPPAI